MPRGWVALGEAASNTGKRLTKPIRRRRRPDDKAYQRRAQKPARQAVRPLARRALTEHNGACHCIDIAAKPKRAVADKRMSEARIGSQRIETQLHQRRT
jgi:hypothetical protein